MTLTRLFTAASLAALSLYPASLAAQGTAPHPSTCGAEAAQPLFRRILSLRVDRMNEHYARDARMPDPPVVVTWRVRGQVDVSSAGEGPEFALVTLQVEGLNLNGVSLDEQGRMDPFADPSPVWHQQVWLHRPTGYFQASFARQPRNLDHARHPMDQHLLPPAIPTHFILTHDPAGGASAASCQHRIDYAWTDGPLFTEEGGLHPDGQWETSDSWNPAQRDPAPVPALFDQGVPVSGFLWAVPARIRDMADDPPPGFDWAEDEIDRAARPEPAPDSGSGLLGM